MKINYLWILLAGVFCQSCATLSKEECHSADWQMIGFEDGSQGHHSQRIGAHREACAEHGVTPNMEHYLLGHKKGLGNYCNFRNGLLLGERGGSYNGVCPAPLDQEFRKGYRDGKALYAMQEELQAIENDYQTTLQEINEMETELGQKKEMIIAQSTGATLRRELLAQIPELESAIAYREDTLEHLTHQRNRVQRRYNQARSNAGLN